VPGVVLHVAQGGASVQRDGDRRMPQRVRGQSLPTLDAGSPSQPAHQLPQLPLAQPATARLAGGLACCGRYWFADADTSSVELASNRRGAVSDSDRIVGVPCVRTHGAGEVSLLASGDGPHLSSWHVF
jgi:hypothetical protein